MSNLFAYAPFEGVAGSDLNTLVGPDPWETILDRFAGAASNALVMTAEGRIRQGTQASCYYLGTASPARRDYLVTADMHVRSLRTGDFFMLSARFSSSTTQYRYSFIWSRNSNSFILQRYFAGSGATVATASGAPDVANNLSTKGTCRPEIRVRGDRVICKVDGVVVIDYTDPAPIWDANFPGLAITGASAAPTDQTGIHAKNFRAKLLSAPQQFGFDDFTSGSTGDDLGALANWSRHPDYATAGRNAIKTAAGRFRRSGTASVGYLHAGTPASADYEVSATMHAASVLSGDNFLVCARCDPSSLSAASYQFGWTQASGWRLLRYKGGSGAAVATGSGPAVSAGNSYRLRIRVVGPVVTGYANGAEVVAYTDPDPVAAPGQAVVIWGGTAATSDSTGLHAAGFLATGLGTIELSLPQDFQVVPRSIGSCPVAGTYTGDPGSIEYRWAGGAWQTLVASPSGGTFSGTATGLTGTGTLEVRFASDPTVSDSAERMAVGDLGTVTGQSNAQGSGFNANRYTGTQQVSAYSPSGAWELITDPACLSRGTAWPLFAASVTGYTGRPLGLMLLAIGGSSITGSPGIGTWTPSDTDPSRPVGRLRDAVARFGQPTFNLWYQGEAEAAGGVSQATYYNAFSALAAEFWSILGVPTMTGQLHQSQILNDGNEAVIRLAIAQGWGLPHVLQGPNFSDISLTNPPGDGIHFRTDEEIQTVAARWWARVQATGLLIPGTNAARFAAHYRRRRAG